MEHLEVLMMTPLTEKAYGDYLESKSNDTELPQLKLMILKGWPKNLGQVPTNIRKYFPIRDELNYTVTIWCFQRIKFKE